VTTGLHHDSHHPTISTTSHHQNQGREKWESRDVGWDGTLNDHKNTRHDHPLASLRQPTVCMPSRLSVSGKQSGCAICRFRAGIPADAQHNKAPPDPRRRMSIDVVQVDPAVHCMRSQIRCSCHSGWSNGERTRRKRAVICSRCDRIRPRLRSCVPTLVGAGSGSRRAGP
jgi:hypothetical protein